MRVTLKRQDGTPPAKDAPTRRAVTMETARQLVTATAEAYFNQTDNAQGDYKGPLSV